MSLMKLKRHFFGIKVLGMFNTAQWHYNVKYNGFYTMNDVKLGSYSLGWRGIVNLCENGDKYLIPTSAKTFFEKPRSHKYNCDDCIAMFKGSPILRHHLALTELDSTGGSIANTGALFWLAHSTKVLYQTWSLRFGVSWLSNAFMIMSTDPKGRSENKKVKVKWIQSYCLVCI